MVIAKGDSRIAEITGKVGERLGEYFWIGRVSSDDINYIIAVSRKDPLDEVDTDHIDFYMLVPVSDHSYLIFEYKRDAVQTRLSP